MPGTVIDLDTHRVNGPGRFISYEGVEDPISTNGRHPAVRVEGDVGFDDHNQNVHPYRSGGNDSFRLTGCTSRKPTSRVFRWIQSSN